LQASPQLDFDFNITHDGDWVAIAFVGSLGKQLTMTSAANVGIDVMEIQLPKFEKSVLDFVDTMDMTLTPRERDWILSDYTHDTFVTQHDRPSNLSLLEYDQLKKLYTLWTYKEAFTKAKGMGLGYDFQTIEIVKLGDEVSITAADKAEKGLSIFQMVLPPGQSSARKAGGGTGLSSLLVVFELTKEEAISSRTMGVSQAQQEGMLRLWTMDRLVDASRQAMEQG
jgi:phosphopantetheine--protein transferase-like protein